MTSGWGGLVLWAAAGALADSRGQEASEDDAAGERGRSELAALVKRALEEQVPAQKSELVEKERVFALDLTVVEAAQLRVLATSGEEEARRAAGAIGAARTVFAELTGSNAIYPPALSAYMLGTTEAKGAFLGKHPRLGPETRERLARLENAGVPETSDWAFWEGDAEKRLDATVRLSLDWLMRAEGVTIDAHPWLHEGLGFYLTHALLGTRLTWFVQPRAGDPKRDPDNVALKSQMNDFGADWLALARGQFAPAKTFDLEELLHLEVAELDPADHLRAHALAAYLVEVQRSALGSVLTRVGAGDDPRAVLEETLGFSLGDLRTRLHAWLEQREVLVARAEGRRTDEELLEAWGALSVVQRDVALAAFRRRLTELDTQQMRCVRAVLAKTAPNVPKAGELDFFDPKVHAPSQPIARKRLSSTDGRVKRLVKDVRKQPDPRAPVLVCDYDWGSGRVVRNGDRDDRETIFQNALRGVPPDADLARALVLKALDHPDERKLQGAFSHAYTDREGNVYPLSLFEMWATGETIEMPDVDTLGIVHEVLDEWRRWSAPVDAAEHGSLYKVIGELFLTCKRSRELRQVLADLYFLPSTTLAGYEKQLLNLQALLASVDSDVARLAPLLPDGKKWESFLTELVARCQKDYKLFGLGRRRASQLRLDALALRKVLGAALDEGARFVPSEEPAGKH